MNRCPTCGLCRHLKIGTRTCAAYPDGIPDIIWVWLADHRRPVAGDGGIRFEPREDLDPEVVADGLAFDQQLRERLAALGLHPPSSPSEKPPEA